MFPFSWVFVEMNNSFTGPCSFWRGQKNTLGIPLAFHIKEGKVEEEEELQFTHTFKKKKSMNSCEMDFFFNLSI